MINETVITATVVILFWTSLQVTLCAIELRRIRQLLFEKKATDKSESGDNK